VGGPLFFKIFETRQGGIFEQRVAIFV
jgi:hypothetical protein